MVFNPLSFLFYDGGPESFVSDFALEESIARLSAATRQGLQLPFRFKLSGRVRRHHVFLTRMFPWGQNSFSPCFQGAFVVREGKTWLKGQFATSAVVRILALSWLYITLLVIIFNAAALCFFWARSAPRPRGQYAGTAVLLAEFLLYPVIFGIIIFFGKRIGERDPAVVREHIEQILNPMTRAMKHRHDT